jgi:hypothetical protein
MIALHITPCRLGSYYMPPAEYFEWTQAQAWQKMQKAQVSTHTGMLHVRHATGACWDGIANDSVACLAPLHNCCP